MAFKIPKNYREMIETVLGPYFNFIGVSISKDGILHLTGTNRSLMLDGRHLYVSINGEELFNVKKSTSLFPFNLNYKDNMIAMIEMLCQILTDQYLDDEDEIKTDKNGKRIPIVKIVKRKAIDSDPLPPHFNGCIYELWCRDNTNVIVTAFEEDKRDDSRCILRLIYNYMTTYHKGSYDRMLSFEKICYYVDKFSAKIQEESMEYAATQANLKIDEIETIEDADTEDEFEEEVEVKRGKKVERDYGGNNLGIVKDTSFDFGEEDYFDSVVFK
jgi:hypothetical protein